MEKTDIHIIGLGNLGSAFLEGLMTSNKEHSIKAVSYTHLTLPTNREV